MTSLTYVELVKNGSYLKNLLGRLILSQEACVIKCVDRGESSSIIVSIMQWFGPAAAHDRSALVYAVFPRSRPWPTKVILPRLHADLCDPPIYIHPHHHRQTRIQ